MDYYETDTMFLLLLSPSGPLLRLEKPGHRLTKAERYGQPYDRPIYSSAIPPRKMQAIVQSYLGFGLQGLKPEDGGWNWQDLQDINQQIHWQVRYMCCSVFVTRRTIKSRK
eukprot:GHUV01034083.1.p1 GENE.GHUV01034083.1~~GHUV01034083.1.p1  ORF type:complete len:111 (+),score=14.40 GHUV01034083.1:90-422(+)